jgi:meiosis-specific protein HOP1
MKTFNDHLEFTKRIGCPSEVAVQLFRRLQTEGELAFTDPNCIGSPAGEGFVAQMETTVDELGLVETQKPVGGKRKRPRAKAGSKYKFITAVKKSQKYKGYFDPERDISTRLARLGDLVRPAGLLWQIC